MPKYERGLIRADSGRFVDKGNQVFDVRHPDFEGGARGDGLHDDSGAIQAAINEAASEGGGTVYFPISFASYLLRSPLSVPSNITLLGAGRRFSVLKLADGVETHVIQNSDQVGGNAKISIRDLGIDGNRANMDSGAAANSSLAVYMVGVDGLHLENVRVVDILDQGFKLKDCTNLTGGGLEVDGAGTDGFSLDNVDDGELTNLIARNCDGLNPDGTTRSASCWGYEIEDGSARLRLTNVYAEDCSAAGGLHLQSHGSLYCDDVTITNLVVNGATSGSGFGIDSGHTRITLNGYTARNVRTGISLSSGQNLTVTGLDVYATTWGVRFVSDTTDANLRFVSGRIKSDLHGVRFDTGVQVLGPVRFIGVDVEAGGTGSPWNLLSGASAEDCQVIGGSLVNTGTAEAVTVKAIPPTGSGYQTNGALSTGTDTITVDTGTGTITEGSKITFATHSRKYTVTTALSGGSLVVSPALTEDVPDNTAITVRAIQQGLLFNGVRIRAEEVTDGFSPVAVFVNDGNTGITFRDCDISCDGSDSLFLVSVGDGSEVAFRGGSMKVDSPVDMNGLFVDENANLVLDGVLIENVVGGSSKYAVAVDTGADVQLIGVRFKDVNRALALAAVCTGSLIGCRFENVTTTKMSDPTNTGWRIRDNTGYVTHNVGTGTVASGNTSVDVTHGLDYTPRLQDIRITPHDAVFAALSYYISAVTATTFTVTVTSAPGSDADFGWQAGL